MYVKIIQMPDEGKTLKTHASQCLWLEVSPTNGKAFWVGNIYRPPTATVEFNDRFEDFIGVITKEDK